MNLQKNRPHRVGQAGAMRLTNHCRQSASWTLLASRKPPKRTRQRSLAIPSDFGLPMGVRRVW